MEGGDREKDVSAWMFGGELSIYNSLSCLTDRVWMWWMLFQSGEDSAYLNLGSLRPLWVWTTPLPNVLLWSFDPYTVQLKNRSTTHTHTKSTHRTGKSLSHTFLQKITDSRFFQLNRENSRNSPVTLQLSNQTHTSAVSNKNTSSNLILANVTCDKCIYSPLILLMCITITAPPLTTHRFHESLCGSITDLQLCLLKQKRVLDTI